VDFSALSGGRCGAKTGHFSLVLEAKKQKRIPFLKNEPENILKIKDWRTKTNPNEPKNEAEKLLKTRTCGKNKPKNEAGHVVENKRRLRNRQEAKIGAIPPAESCPSHTSGDARDDNLDVRIPGV
jgi:hypothetical protein